MAAFGGAHHQAGFQQMATGFPGVVAGGFIQGGAPKVLLVNNLCEGVSCCFTLWPQCCLTDGWIFQVTCNQIFTLCGVRPTPLTKERRRPPSPFSTVAEPALGLMVPISRFRAFRWRKQRKNGKQRVKNGWIGIWRRDTCEDPGMPHRPKQAGCCCADWSGPAVQQKVQCVGRIRDGPAGVGCHFCIPLRRQSRVWVCCCRRASCAQHLKDCPFYGQNLHVVPSSRAPSFPEMPRTASNFALLPEHQSVGMPRPDSDPTSLALTSDYTGSPLHRFGVGSKHAMVCMPLARPP
eukprot:COSAG04_NODE_1875_length_5334_cov_1.252197_2_plen_292_part_00